MQTAAVTIISAYQIMPLIPSLKPYTYRIVFYGLYYEPHTIGLVMPWEATRTIISQSFYKTLFID